MEWIYVGIAFLSFIVGVVAEHLTNRAKSIGNLIVVDDPDDGQRYLFLELTKTDSLNIRNGDTVSLTVRSGKATRE